MINVLLVEDDIQFAERCAEFLMRHYYQVQFCDNAEKAKTLLNPSIGLKRSYLSISNVINRLNACLSVLSK